MLKMVVIKLKVMEDYKKNTILNDVFTRIVFQLNNGIDSNFDEYKRVYDEINEGHNKSLEEIKTSFYQMAFCIEVRKTTVLTDIERDECDVLYNELKTLK
jgi:hypothetical protein